MALSLAKNIYNFEPLTDFHQGIPKVRGFLASCLAQLWEFEVYLSGAFDERNGREFYDYELAAAEIEKTPHAAFFELDLTVIDNAGASICTFLVEEVY